MVSYGKKTRPRISDILGDNRMSQVIDRDLRPVVIAV